MFLWNILSVIFKELPNGAKNVEFFFFKDPTKTCKINKNSILFKKTT